MGYSTMAPLCRKIVAMPLITFEGSEGCGKSTQVKRLAARLEKSGIAAAVFREPRGTPVCGALLHLLQQSLEKHALTPENALLPFGASRSPIRRAGN